MRGEIKQQVVERGLQPGLGVIMVGKRPEAAADVMTETKMAKQCGFHVRDVLLPEDATQQEVVSLLIN